MLMLNTAAMAARAEGRLRTVLIAVLAIFAIGMATVGVGTLVAFSTGLRSREFGIRTAMGAEGSMIVREVIADALRMSGKGLLLGAVGTIGAYFAFIPMLYFNAKIFDWRVAAGAMGMMTLLVVATSVVPALRAAKLNPADVLRMD
jgi:ABC-type antimicrobial peptide transport system permease subunit